MQIRAAIFDLDGVIADTARGHFEAWSRLANELDIHFDTAINERLKGVSRMASLDILLELSARTYTEDQRLALAARKNGYYQEIVESATVDDLLPGAVRVLRECRTAGLRIALASASKNAPRLIEVLNLGSLFDFVADANHVRHPKPDPEIFLSAAEGLGVEPRFCVGFEDAVAGVQSIKSAGMLAIGVGDQLTLAEADRVVVSLEDFSVDSLLDH